MTEASRRLSAGSLLAAVAIAGAFGCASAPPPVKTAQTVALPSAPVDVASAIVIVEADGMDPDMAAPWSTGKSWSRTMTGLVVEGHQILVVGWGLRGHQHIRVEKQGTTARSDAREVFEDDDRGLRLLTVDDPAFWSGLAPAALSPAVSAPGSVRVFHAASEGRVESATARVTGLRAWGRGDAIHLKLGQVDSKQATISDVIAEDGAVVGVLDNAYNDNVFAVPSTLLADFLAEAKRPGYRGVALFGANLQWLRSATLREELGLGAKEGGVRVTHVFALGSASGVLLPGDLLLTIEGKKIENDATYDRPGSGVVAFASLFSEGHHPGDVVELGIQRDGARKTVKLTLKEWPSSADFVSFVTPHEAEKVYRVQGGLVFENLSVPYLRTFGKDWETIAPPRLLEIYALDRADAPEAGAHPVVLTRVLADPATLGYQQLRDLVVESINGVRLRSLDDVASAFAHPSGAFVVVTLAPGQGVRRIVLDAKEAAAANERLRASYELPKSPAGGS